MCASVVDRAMLNSLCDATKQILFPRGSSCQMIIAGILLVRKGEITGSLGFTHHIPGFSIQPQIPSNPHPAGPSLTDEDLCPEGPYQVIRGQSIYHAWSRKALDPNDTIISCSPFNTGIHVWCVNVVHEPSHSRRFNLQRGFLIEWQVFKLEGQPG